MTLHLSVSPLQTVEGHTGGGHGSADTPKLTFTFSVGVYNSILEVWSGSSFQPHAPTYKTQIQNIFTDALATEVGSSLTGYNKIYSSLLCHMAGACAQGPRILLVTSS